MKIIDSGNHGKNHKRATGPTHTSTFYHRWLPVAPHKLPNTFNGNFLLLHLIIPLISHYPHNHLCSLNVLHWSSHVSLKCLNGPQTMGLALTQSRNHMDLSLLTLYLLAVLPTSNILNFYSDQSEMLQKTFTSNLLCMTHSAATHQLTLLLTPSIPSHLVWTNMADNLYQTSSASIDAFLRLLHGTSLLYFSLPSVGVKSWSSNKPPPAHLAYVEWFIPFSRLHPGHHQRLYKISQHCLDGVQQTSIIPVELIQQSVHLIPGFGAIAPAHWKSSNVLEEASHFYASSFSDCFQYLTLYKDFVILLSRV